jgi:uncharacterized protein with FMN-binding domain
VELVKRIVLWAMSTLTVVTLLFGYHAGASTGSASGATSSVAAPADPSSTTSDTGSASSSTGSSSSGDGSASSSATGGASATSTTVTGAAADTRWGPVQVRITVADGAITDVSVVEYPSGNPKDQQINAYAIPTLVQETLDAQSANIDMVSGATVTSEGYLESLQSALDHAGL